MYLAAICHLVKFTDASVAPDSGLNGWYGYVFRTEKDTGCPAERSTLNIKLLLKVACLDAKNYLSGAVATLNEQRFLEIPGKTMENVCSNSNGMLEFQKVKFEQSQSGDNPITPGDYCVDVQGLWMKNYLEVKEQRISGPLKFQQLRTDWKFSGVKVGFNKPGFKKQYFTVFVDFKNMISEQPDGRKADKLLYGDMIILSPSEYSSLQKSGGGVSTKCTLEDRIDVTIKWEGIYFIEDPTDSSRCAAAKKFLDSYLGDQ